MPTAWARPWWWIFAIRSYRRLVQVQVRGFCNVLPGVVVPSASPSAVPTPTLTPSPVPVTGPRSEPGPEPASQPGRGPGPQGVPGPSPDPDEQREASPEPRGEDAPNRTQVGTSTPAIPTPPPSTPTPEPIRATVETLRAALDSLPRDRLDELAQTLAQGAHDLMCRIAAGEFEPTMTIADLTEDRLKQLVLKTYCAVSE